MILTIADAPTIRGLAGMAADQYTDAELVADYRVRPIEQQAIARYPLIPDETGERLETVKVALCYLVAGSLVRTNTESVQSDRIGDESATYRDNAEDVALNLTAIGWRMLAELYPDTADDDIVDLALFGFFTTATGSRGR